MQQSEWVSALCSLISFSSGRAVQFAQSPVHWAGPEPGPSAVTAWSPNHGPPGNSHIHSVLDSFPIEVITEYWRPFPLLHSRSVLVFYRSMWASLVVAQMVKNLPTVQETWVQSLGWEDTLEKLPKTGSLYSLALFTSSHPAHLASDNNQSVFCMHNFAFNFF